MRGGEKVLEALLELFPRAPIYTLFHEPGKVSARIESHGIVTSWLLGYPEKATDGVRSGHEAFASSLMTRSPARSSARA